jgi:hypothetical protein
MAPCLRKGSIISHPKKGETHQEQFLLKRCGTIRKINSRDLRDSSWQTGIFAGRRNYFLQPPGSFTAYRTFSYGFIVRIAHILFELDSMDLRLEYIRSLRDDRSPASKSSLIKGAIISQSKKGAKYQPMLYMLYLPLQQLVAIYKRFYCI